MALRHGVQKVSGSCGRENKSFIDKTHCVRCFRVSPIPDNERRLVLKLRHRELGPEWP